MNLSTHRLRIHPVTDLADISVLASVFNTNPDFIEASEQINGKRAYTREDIEMYVWQESTRENSHCLAIRLGDTEEVVGTAALLVPNPDDGRPWLGLLVIGQPWQRLGLAREAVTVIERWLGAEGWAEVRLNVMTSNHGALQFWKRCGYSPVERSRDLGGRHVHIMAKRLPHGHAEVRQGA